MSFSFSFFFFFNDTATTEIYTLSLHDALPTWRWLGGSSRRWRAWPRRTTPDRKSTRLNFSHDQISYAVFCLKKKKKNICDKIIIKKKKKKKNKLKYTIFT